MGGGTGAGAGDGLPPSFGPHQTLSLRRAAVTSVVIVCMLLFAGAVSTIFARELPTRLGVPSSEAGEQSADGVEAGAEGGAGAGAAQDEEEAPAPAPEAAPQLLFVLEHAGPMAADGGGRLILLAPTTDGYGLYGSVGPVSRGDFELMFRRKGVYGTSLAVGPGGLLCVGTTAGVDCIDGAGRVVQLEHSLLTNIVGVTLDEQGRLWALRSVQGGTTGLQIVRTDFSEAPPTVVLSLRQAVTAFLGNGLAAAPGGDVLVPVVENDIHRVLHVGDDGRPGRRDDFWRIAGGIAVDRRGTALVTGTKRPQSVREQRNPVDAVLLPAPNGPETDGPSAGAPGPGAPGVAVRFPSAPSGLGSRMLGYATLGGDGVLYVMREQPVMTGDGPARQRPTLWAVEWGRPGMLGPADQVIDFRIPYVAELADAAFVVEPSYSPLDYTGPLLIGRGRMLVVAGVNFAGKAGERRVLIGGRAGTAELWSDDLVLVRVPEDAPPGTAEVRVALGGVLSNSEFIEVKTADVLGWFQIGSPGMEALLRQSFTIRGYSARIAIAGTTRAGERVVRAETMETPGLFHVRLPDGVYEAAFSASYLVSEVRYGPENQYVGSSHVPVVVPEQTFAFEISDDNPVVIWMPMMLGE